ncbi:MAG: 3-deoxy-7-phosphoheptulonate synthase [Parcubacteria group bacterium CG11_big_fil_rev_8_21_14_0_20_39_22]|nr:MAG: 3-deoxy-7-phosphoheptulonate synthase [Parcubacteria group bacterium CG11_big_fil_rev_8_21_14_0_20_39_22]
MQEETHNTNINSISPLPSPESLKKGIPLSEISWKTVDQGRKVIPQILSGKDRRLLAIVGPCSIHNIDESKRYAKKLSLLSDELKDVLYIVMRVNCDKPRSRAKTNGRASWQGLFNDPKMNGSYDMELGFRLARELILYVNEMGLPVATEMLEKINYQMIDDLLSYVWIGARNTNSQEQKKVASGASTVVGFKNPTDGLIDVAAHAIEFAKHCHVFAAPTDNGVTSRFSTKGNAYGHLILRGSDNGPNCDKGNIRSAVKKLSELGLISRVIVDCSHGNSHKNHEKQREVIGSLLPQIKEGGDIAGIMYESFLEDGKQNIPVDLSKLRPGVSVTDGCDGWKRTEKTLREFAEELRKITKEKR